MESEVWEAAPRAGEAIGAELIRRRQRIDQEELEFSCLAAQFAQTDEYDWQGFESPIAWLKANCHMSGGAASARICASQQLERLSQDGARGGVADRARGRRPHADDSARQPVPAVGARAGLEAANPCLAPRPPPGRARR